ncbi:MAG TPA: hypothetical protein VES97_06135 [Solirubrobacteraceae bacterium]|nr:hypothetical protein [Solirubrobacteraceae bacterium]
MAPCKPLIGMVALAVLAPAPALAASTPSHAPQTGPLQRSLLRSRQLWATINVCNPKDQPDWVGVRGSMPGDGQARDTLSMRFRLQYLSSRTRHWADLASTATAGFIVVGSGSSARQEGQSFQLMPVLGRPAFDLRGVVEFQWRRGRSVLLSASRPTTAGRVSLAGADPAGFSAATCLIG